MGTVEKKVSNGDPYRSLVWVLWDLAGTNRPDLATLELVPWCPRSRTIAQWPCLNVLCLLLTTLARTYAYQSDELMSVKVCEPVRTGPSPGRLSVCDGFDRLEVRLREATLRSDLYCRLL